MPDLTVTTIDLYDEIRVSGGTQEIALVSGKIGAARTEHCPNSLGVLVAANGRRKSLTAGIAINLTGTPIFLGDMSPHGSGKLGTCVPIL